MVKQLATYDLIAAKHLIIIKLIEALNTESEEGDRLYNYSIGVAQNLAESELTIGFSAVHPMTFNLLECCLSTDGNAHFEEFDYESLASTVSDLTMFDKYCTPTKDLVKLVASFADVHPHSVFAQVLISTICYILNASSMNVLQSFYSRSKYRISKKHLEFDLITKAQLATLEALEIKYVLID